MYRTVFFAASLTAAIGFVALGAAAQTQTSDRMGIVAIATMLEGQGYKVLEIELEHGRYEVDMLDNNGMKVEAYLNPVTGDVLPYRDDDCYGNATGYCDRDDD